MMFQCVRSVRRCGIGVLWGFKVLNFQTAKEYFQVMYIMMQISGRVCQHQLLPNKPLPNKQVACFTITTTLAMMLMHRCELFWTGQRPHGSSWSTGPEVYPIPNSFRG